MLHIVGYARVSSREQAENSHALEQQIARLEAAGASEILFDIDSGSKDQRPEFNRLLRLIHSCNCDEVVVTRLDRLTRSLPTLRKVLDEFRNSSVNLRALDDSIDLSTAAGKFHLNMLGALAEMEVDRLSERVRHGWQHLRDRKIAMNSPFGYIKVNDRHCLDHAPFLCSIDGKQEKSKAVIAREIVDSFLEKATLRLALRVINERYGIQIYAHNKNGGRPGGRVARDMFRFSPAGLRNWLTNPVLQGHICYLRRKDGHLRDRKDWDIHYNTHSDQRLITDDELKQIDQILATNAKVKGYGSTALKYPLSGLIYCGECRSACYSLSGANNYHKAKKLGIPPDLNYYFQCKNWRSRSCTNSKLVRMELVEQAAIAALTQRASTITQLADTPQIPQEPLELKELKAQLVGLEQLGYNSVIEDAKSKLRTQIENLAHKFQFDSVELNSNSELLLEVFQDLEFWSQLSPGDRRRVYRQMIDRIVIRSGAVEFVSLKV